MKFQLHLKLKSDATFGRGDGVAGLVDAEVEHDEFGLPFLRGRTLKGLLVEECANLLFTLSQVKSPALGRSQAAARWLFGQAGSTLDDDAMMHVGAAMLPEELREAVAADVRAKPSRLTPADVLESLTAIRRQTTVDEGTGAPDEGSLRSIRVVLRKTPFIAYLDFDAEPDDDAKALLEATALCFRRAGTGRNRGRGRLVARLCDEEGNNIAATHFAHFQRAVMEGAR
jgi:RAMP superfamily